LASLSGELKVCEKRKRRKKRRNPAQNKPKTKISIKFPLLSFSII
jgi:hypothetical protein